MLKLVGFLLVGLLAACRSQDAIQPDPPAPEAPAEAEAPADHPTARDKARIVRTMEQNMRVFLGKAVEKFEEIQHRLRTELEAMEVPPSIEAVEKELADFYSEREEAYEAAVDALRERADEELTITLEFMEPKVWEVAFEVVGTEDVGEQYGTRTGIEEVDDSAEATIDLIRRRSMVDELLDAARTARRKRIAMDRVFKHDTEGKGRLSLFASEPMRHFFRKNEDVIAMTVTYQKRGLDPDVPLEFLQVARNRIVRGGTTLVKSPFEWDTNLGNPEGRLRIEQPDKDPHLLVSKVFYPRIDMDNVNFEKLKDYTAIRDYKTVVVNKETGEILDCVSWQFFWYISHFGAIAVEVGPTPAADPAALEVRSLRKAGS
jgi:hypothetical protein